MSTKSSSGQRGLYWFLAIGTPLLFILLLNLAGNPKFHSSSKDVLIFSFTIAFGVQCFRYLNKSYSFWFNKIILSWPIRLMLLAVVVNIFLLLTESLFTRSIVYPTIIYWFICFGLWAAEKSGKEANEEVATILGVDPEEVDKMLGD